MPFGSSPKLDMVLHSLPPQFADGGSVQGTSPLLQEEEYLSPYAFCLPRSEKFRMGPVEKQTANIGVELYFIYLVIYN